LRFSTTEIRKDFTSLHIEIQYLKNYIDLESLRISTPENILFEDKTENKDLKIAPMILIPFVENAFKHGNLRNFRLKFPLKQKRTNCYFIKKIKFQT
jgi:sensor histidine kinase YesM